MPDKTLWSLRRWRPPTAFISEDPLLGNLQLIIEAARKQRRFWKKIAVSDLQLVQFEALSTAAAGIAAQFERRHRLIPSKGWQRWCRTSVIAGSSALIKWAQRPETELPMQKLEAPETKLQRVQQQCKTVWGYTQPTSIGLHQLPMEWTNREEEVVTTRITSKGVEEICARGSRALDAGGTPDSGRHAH